MVVGAFVIVLLSFAAWRLFLWLVSSLLSQPEEEFYYGGENRMDIKQLIEAGQEHTFYTSAAWERVRKQALKRDHWECQRCRAKGKLNKAIIVHHIKHLKDRPDLALCLDDPETGERQLTSLCKACHEEEHPERFPQNNPKPPLTAERWD